MALWGSNDNVTSAGVVTVSYDDLTVTGDGTAFGAVGSAKTGDVIRFGARGPGAASTYFLVDNKKNLSATIMTQVLFGNPELTREFYKYIYSNF